jgi:hypothetical protein
MFANNKQKQFQKTVSIYPFAFMIILLFSLYVILRKVCISLKSFINITKLDGNKITSFATVRKIA